MLFRWNRVSLPYLSHGGQPPPNTNDVHGKVTHAQSLPTPLPAERAGARLCLARASLVEEVMKPKILVPFEFSEPAERALAWAAEFQRSTGAPPLHLLHAITSRPAGTGDVSLQVLLPNADEIAALEEAMKDKARGHDVAATAAVWIRASNVGDIVIDAANSVGAELVVMGSHGRSGLKRLVLGSVAEHVLRNATCPVVTVRAAHLK